MTKKSHKRAPWMCGQCKSGFMSELAVRNHIKDAHPTIFQCGVYRCHARVDGPDYDDSPSISSLMVQAEQDRAMGVLNPDDEWLLP